MQIINSEQTRQLLGFKSLIPALREMFRQDCQVPLRHMHAIENGGSSDGTLLIMPAWQAGKRLGIKTVSIYPGNSQQGLPGLHSVFVLYDATTGVPLAMLDGNEITSRRTAAAAALAADRLARTDAERLLVVGAGRVASLLADAFSTVRPIRQVKVWNINASRSEELVRQLVDAGYQAEICNSLQEGSQWADIISCATLATQPLIQGKWLKPGTHLDLIGSFTPTMRESDDDCFRLATVFIDTSEALKKSGDLLEPMKSGAFAADKVAATLEQLCRGVHAGRRDAQEITIFKAVGTALEDLAAASLVYDALTDHGKQ